MTLSFLLNRRCLNDFSAPVEAFAEAIYTDWASVVANIISQMAFDGSSLIPRGRVDIPLI
jgi:hypothetical protein